MQKPKKFTRKDYEVLETYADFAQAGVKDPLRKAIIKAYDYDLNDRRLAAKVYNRKRTLCQTKKVNEIFEMAGIDKLKIASKLAELMDAKEQLVFHGEIQRDGDGEPITVPDLKIQLGATTLAANIAGITQKQKTQDISREETRLIVFVESEENARKRIAEFEPEKEVIQESYTVEESIN